MKILIYGAGVLGCNLATFACYKTDGNLKKLKGNTAYLNRLIDANIEGYRAIQNAGHEILPKSDQDFESEAYRKTCLRFYKLISLDRWWHCPICPTTSVRHWQVVVKMGKERVS